MSDRHATHPDAHATPASGNPFLTAPLGRLFLSNALPMAVVLSMGGLLTLVDGIFVGRFVGPDALTAVGLGFPVVMILIALATLIGGGMSSLLARALGAGNPSQAGKAFAGAHGLALLLSGLVMLTALLAGRPLIDRLAWETPEIATMTRQYLLILILGTPVQFILSVHADALRNEGRATAIAGLSVLLNLLNMAANWLAIVVLQLGVAGSALGTVVAQGIGLSLLLAYRARARGLLPIRDLGRYRWTSDWRGILGLGLPLCLSFIGIALVSGSVILTLKATAGDNYGTLVAAYGVVTRILGFVFLPQMAIALATQSISGNNFGAGFPQRARAALRLAVIAAFLWCLVVAVTLLLLGPKAGALFSEDPQVALSVASILRPMLVFYAASGPILVLALHYQAIGRPLRTAVLTLIKPWLLTPALVLTAGLAWGARGVFLAFPLADGLMILVTALLLLRGQKGSTGF